METTIAVNDGLTKAEERILPPKTFISQAEAEGYCEYKRRKKRTEIAMAFMRSFTSLTIGTDVRMLCERSARLQQAPVKMPTTRLQQYKELFAAQKIIPDCVVGGEGETPTKAKVCELKQALKLGAKECSVTITPSLLRTMRFADVCKEMKKMRKIAGKTPIKAVLGEGYSYPTALRLARLCADCGMAYFSTPWFEGCEKLKRELFNGCKLEVYNVNTLLEFQKLLAAGVDRIGLTRGWDFYNEWLKDVDKINPAALAQEEMEAETKNNE